MRAPPQQISEEEKAKLTMYVYAFRALAQPIKNCNEDRTMCGGDYVQAVMTLDPAFAKWIGDHGQPDAIEPARTLVTRLQDGRALRDESLERESPSPSIRKTRANAAFSPMTSENL